MSAANRTLMGAWMLGDTIDRVESFIDVFIGVYTLLILLFIITSWIPGGLPYTPWLNRIQRFLYDVCDPFLRVFRRVVPPIGPLDLSPMVAVVVLIVIDRIAHTLLDLAH
jgi:YggT family protein